MPDGCVPGCGEVTSKQVCVLILNWKSWVELTDDREQWKLLQGRCVMVLRIAGVQVTNNGQHHYPRINESAHMLEE
jgi:hypothetical protein